MGKKKLVKKTVGKKNCQKKIGNKNFGGKNFGKKNDGNKNLVKHFFSIFFNFERISKFVHASTKKWQPP